MSHIPPSQLHGHLKGSFVPARRNLGGWEGGSWKYTFDIKNKHLWVAGRLPPNPLLSTHPPTHPSDTGRDVSLSPIEKPHLKIDYTIKMEGDRRQKDLEYQLEGPPRRGPPKKNPPLEGNRQGPRKFGRQRNGFSGGRTIKGIFLPGQKVTWEKNKLTEKVGEVAISILTVWFVPSYHSQTVKSYKCSLDSDTARNNKTKQTSSSIHASKWRQGPLNSPRAGWEINKETSFSSHTLIVLF